MKLLSKGSESNFTVMLMRWLLLFFNKCVQYNVIFTSIHLAIRCYIETRLYFIILFCIDIACERWRWSQKFLQVRDDCLAYVPTNTIVHTTINKFKVSCLDESLYFFLYQIFITKLRRCPTNYPLLSFIFIKMNSSALNTNHVYV